MAKDDYHVLVYKILTYVYACTKRKIAFRQEVYDKTIGKGKVNEEYLTEVYHMLAKEGLVTGVSVTEAWGRDLILLSEESDMRITEEGIRYLQENDIMQKVKQLLLDKVDIFAGLIRIMEA